MLHRALSSLSPLQLVFFGYLFWLFITSPLLFLIIRQHLVAWGRTEIHPGPACRQRPLLRTAEMEIAGPGGPPGVHSTHQHPRVTLHQEKRSQEDAFEVEPGLPEGLKLCSREEPAPFQPE